MLLSHFSLVLLLKSLYPRTSIAWLLCICLTPVFIALLSYPLAIYLKIQGLPVIFAHDQEYILFGFKFIPLKQIVIIYLGFLFAISVAGFLRSGLHALLPILFSVIGNFFLTNPYMVTKGFIGGGSFGLRFSDFCLWYSTSPMYLVFTAVIYIISAFFYMRFERRYMRRGLARPVVILVILLCGNVGMGWSLHMAIQKLFFS